ncbi:unnamed protein product [Oikopleura dioica]|uniref:Uncharacterized protein n=1 Tax=Oikopleura dioica TaxID=34765 RepID=E4WWZ7_OIKDI|nr:unnamed protein product [Oikopleura dioica]
MGILKKRAERKHGERRVSEREGCWEWCKLVWIVHRLCCSFCISIIGLKIKSCWYKCSGKDRSELKRRMSLKIQHSSISTGNLEDWINTSMSHQYMHTESEIRSEQPTRSNLSLPQINSKNTLSGISEAPPARPPPPNRPYPTAPDQVVIDFD